MTIHKDYPCNRDNYQGRRTGPVLYLVYHYVGAEGDARANAWYYHSTPGIRASAHYFVGHAEDGADVWASVAEDCVASHCGRSDGKYKHPACRNANSIGVELCCHKDKAGRWYIDRETLDRGAELGRDIMVRYGITTERVVRHYDVTGKICPAPLVEDAGAWEDFKKRLEEHDMTKEEVQALIDASKPKVFTSVEECPEWARKLVRRAMDEGVIKGDGGGKLHLTGDNLVNLQMMFNMADKAGK